LLGLAVVLLACAVKNYGIYFVAGTPLCSLLCPRMLDGRAAGLPAAVLAFFEAVAWLEDAVQSEIDLVLDDPYRIFSSLAIAPVLEEAVYRGPLFATKRYSRSPLWWLSAVLLAALFALSHERSGLLLLPPFVLGLVSAWLIAATGRLWPGVALHVSNNVYFLSITLYQSIYLSA
jgi:membrane protease YdiL (CAAX protease family)